MPGGVKSLMMCFMCYKR